mmetsp:Transcript_53389/g.134419  ORF Transcript_53389/g.134419 Transcript_53389/m.134419 type:complete len:91 (-) Transcript_53389:568-840(-)
MNEWMDGRHQHSTNTQPKLHAYMHLPYDFARFGPLRFLWCFDSEAMHKTVRKWCTKNVCMCGCRRVSDSPFRSSLTRPQPHTHDTQHKDA